MRMVQKYSSRNLHSLTVVSNLKEPCQSQSFLTSFSGTGMGAFHYAKERERNLKDTGRELPSKD
jgi:hypothetical protein